MEKTKDRLEYPVQFLEEIIKNFTGNKECEKAFLLTASLISLVKEKNIEGIKGWLSEITYNPESLGSAFFMVYSFAQQYLEEISN